MRVRGRSSADEGNGKEDVRLSPGEASLPATIKAFASLVLAIAAVLTAGGLVGWQAAIVVVAVLIVLLLLPWFHERQLRLSPSAVSSNAERPRAKLDLPDPTRSTPGTRGPVKGGLLPSEGPERAGRP